MNRINQEGEIQMKNRVLPVLLAACMLFLLLPLSAGADGGSYYGGATYFDSNYNAYMYSDTHYGIVICRQMNVRNVPSTNGTTYGQIRNGQPVRIMGITTDNNFYLLDLASCGLAADPGTLGYAKSSLIKIDPTFVATTKYTNLYATPWTTELKNGEQSGRFFLVIAEYNNWYAVQLNESAPGTAFIRMGDIGQYSAYQANYVVTVDSAAYDAETWAQLPSISRFTVGARQDVHEDYTLLLFTTNNSQYSAWVPSQNVALLIN